MIQGRQIMKLSEKIVFMRKKRSISQDQLARRLNVSRQAVYKWEAGINTPELDKIYKLAEIFNISYDLLLDEKIDLSEHFTESTVIDTKEGDNIPNEVLEEKEKSPKKGLSKGIMALIISGAVILSLIFTIIIGIFTYRIIDGIDTDTVTGSGTSVDLYPDSDIESDIEEGTEGDSDLDSDADSDTDTDSSTDTDSDTDSDSDIPPITDEPVMITVTFLAGGENMLENESITFEVGKEFGKLPTPYLTGHIFIGWFDKNDTELKNPITEDTIVTEDIVELRAVHMIDANNPPVLIAFNPNGGLMDENDEGRFVVIGKKLGTLPYVEKEGYTLVGWYNENDTYFLNEYTASIQITGQVYDLITLKAIWKENIPCVDGTTTHTFQQWYNVGEATCTVPEKEVRMCRECGYTEYKYIKDSFKDHSFGEWVTKSEGDCESPSVLVHKCSVCGFEETKLGETTTEHQWGVWRRIQEASCTKAEIMQKTCFVCGITESKTTVLPFGHSYSDGQCTLCGEGQYTEGVVYKISGDSAYVSSYTGKDTILRISPNYTPEGEVKSYPVTKIASLENGYIEELIIPEGVEELGRGEWLCPNLKRLRVPTTLKTIGDEAFYSCPISEIHIKDIKAWCGIKSNTESLDGTRKIYTNYDMYLNDELLVDLNVTADITYIGSYVFNGCQSIKTLTMEECADVNNRTIKPGAFSYSGLSSAQISAGSVWSEAFYGCLSLMSVDIIDVVDFQSDNVFGLCRKIFEVYTDKSVSAGDTYYGGVAYYARVIHSSRDEKSAIEITDDGLVFGISNEGNYLLEYRGNETELKLPRSYKDKAYVIARTCFLGSALQKIYVPIEIITVEDMGLYSSKELYIYCEASTKPSGWNTYFGANTTVEYGYTLDY